MNPLKTQQVVLTTSIEAAADLIAQHFAGFSGALCAAGAKALGVVDADTAAGNMAPVNTHGIVLVTAGAAVPVGAEVESDASGRAVPKTAGAANGYALDEATAADQLIRIARGI